MSTPAIPTVQCSSDEERVTLNYEDWVQRKSELTFWILLPDGKPPDADTSTALVGSGTWLPLPAGGTEDAPIRLFVRRSKSSTSWQFRLASVSISVLNVESVVLRVYDFRRKLALHGAVRINALQLKENVLRDGIKCGAGRGMGLMGLGLRLMLVRLVRSV